MARGMGGESISNIAHYVKGIDFPASKDEIFSFAEDNNAPDDLLDVIDSLPDQEYDSMADLVQEVALIE